MSPERETARDRTLALMAKARCDQAFGEGYWEKLSVGERAVRASYEQVVLDAVTRSAINDNDERESVHTMSDDPIWIACEGSKYPLAGGRICAMCGARVPSGVLDGKKVALPHQRQDTIAMIERGDFDA